MTNREYLTQKFAAFQLSEALLVDSGLDLDAEYEDNATTGKAIASLIGQLVLLPRVSSVNENGFSISWDASSLGKYYLWLCKKYGIALDEDTMSLLGLPFVKVRNDW